MNSEIEQLKEIKSIMEKSSRFISLSGWSGVAAGISALIGAFLAYPYVDISDRETIITLYKSYPVENSYEYINHPLSLIAICTFFMAISGAFFFTYIRARKNKVNIWGSMARKVLYHFSIPFISGSIFILLLILRQDFIYVAPLSLIIYGISLFSAAKFTVKETSYLSIGMIVLGLINLFFSGYSYIFWTIGFGIFHIIYGITMWWRYERYNMD